MQFPLVFTDLDGTLLDHYDYSVKAALPTLAALKFLNIPIIANTSKTEQEVTKLYQQLDIISPFIVENGAAVYLPKSSIATQPQDTIERQDYWLKVFSQPRAVYIDLVQQLKADFSKDFTCFSDMTDQAIANITGLSLPAAKLANQRQFGEPVLWQGNHSQKGAFINQAKSLGANVLEGGRFIHICDACDKGQAMNWLAGEYQHQFKQPNVTTIALGDSGNDIAMLEAADIAVQIKSPTHAFPQINQEVVNFIYQTQGFGPVGWAEALTFILGLAPNHGIPSSTHHTLGEFSYG
ncbi:HAD-IIB family hydrolase [Colwellia sp. MEBiC06753]